MCYSVIAFNSLLSLLDLEFVVDSECTLTHKQFYSCSLLHTKCSCVYASPTGTAKSARLIHSLNFLVWDQLTFYSELMCNDLQHVN